jgi:hypothetical protein
MTENERELSEGLRQLASQGPRQAPARLEARLLTEFQRRHRRRRLAIWVPAGAVAAIAAAILLLAGMHQQPQKAATAPAIIKPFVVALDEEAETGFYPLPEADALPPVENAMVVRVQVPVSSLRLMGFPVSAGRAEGAVQADLLLGQDGLARGVRLVE